MKATEFAAVLSKAANDMEALAAREGDFEIPDEVVLQYITNFLTDHKPAEQEGLVWQKMEIHPISPQEILKST